MKVVFFAAYQNQKTNVKCYEDLHDFSLKNMTNIIIIILATKPVFHNLAMG